jgi:hypothetical protein
LFERQFVRFVANVNPIKKQHAKMDVEIQRRTKALYECSGSGMGSVVRAASGVNQVSGDGAIDNALLYANHLWLAGKWKPQPSTGKISCLIVQT